MTLGWFRFDLEKVLWLDHVAWSAWVKPIFDTRLQMVLQLFNPQPISLISEAQFIVVCENWCKCIPSEIFAPNPISQSLRWQNYPECKMFGGPTSVYWILICSVSMDFSKGSDWISLVFAQPFPLNSGAPTTQLEVQWAYSAL